MLIKIILILVLTLSGCVTVTYPDGTVERRMDENALIYARDSVDLAISAYNLYLVTTEDRSRMGTFLRNVERTVRLYNDLAPHFGQEPITLSRVGEELAILQKEDPLPSTENSLSLKGMP